jgi:arylsulfatase
MGLFDPTTAPLSDRSYAVDAWDNLSKKQRHEESMRMAVHAAMVDRVDQNAGRLLNQLQTMDVLENTLVMFLVDNGASPEKPNSEGALEEPWGSVGTFESIGRSWANVADTPLRLWKATSHEGGINTPMIVHWPKGIAESMRGGIYREPCHLIDLLPTWMELAGKSARYPGRSEQTNIPPLDGISLVPSFASESLGREKALYFEFGSGKAVRDGRWKLVRSRLNAWELYDLSQDRTETKNLASAHPQRAKRMEQDWYEWYKDCTGKAWESKKKRKSK